MGKSANAGWRVLGQFLIWLFFGFGAGEHGMPAGGEMQKCGNGFAAGRRRVDAGTIASRIRQNIMYAGIHGMCEKKAQISL